MKTYQLFPFSIFHSAFPFFRPSKTSVTILLFTFFLFPALLSAQTLRGTVRDADRGSGLAGAVVELRPERTGISFLSVVTDSAGMFALADVRAGYYRLEIQAAGYEQVSLAQIDVAAGKDQTFDISLRPAATALPNVTVTARALGRRPAQPLSEIPLSREQTLRFPATFFDPARLAMAYPGVVNNDDQANGLSIRGNNPGALRWRLEGVDIVNPNHLTNAGTFSDRPALASGGVLMFSAQLLDNSALLTGAFPAGYGDALGGVMDIALRRGNPYRYEFTAQAGLLGLDVAAEGPLGKKDRHSFLANYRYSTVGLLADLGVSFGGETIRFQDLSFKFDFAGKKGGQWSVFGIGGFNETLFDHKEDSSEIKQYKDLFDIEFYSRTGILGLSNWTPLSRNSWVRTALILSGQQNERSAKGDGRRETDDQTEVRTGLSTTFSLRLGRNRRFLLGALGQHLNFDLQATNTGGNNRPTGHLDGMLVQPWVNLEIQGFKGRFITNWGFHSSYWKLLDQASAPEGLWRVEPRLSFELKLKPRHRITLALGQYSQLNPLWVYAVENRNAGEAERFPNRDLGLVHAQHSGLGYRWTVSENWVFRAEAFLQELSGLPVSVQPSTFSLINVSEIIALDSLMASGRARNRGLELTAEHYLSSGWFLLANTTLLQARYRGSDKVWRDSRWNVGYIANLTGGKEWSRELPNDRTRSFGANARAVLNGGQREQPIDQALSSASGQTVFDPRDGFSLRQPGFFRLDLRIYWKRSLGNRRNSMLAMDFQNATFQKNIAYRYYDPFTKAIETKEQLALVPNISWRLEF